MILNKFLHFRHSLGLESRSERVYSFLHHIYDSLLSMVVFNLSCSLKYNLLLIESNLLQSSQLGR